MAGSRWEDLAIKKVMAVVEAAVDSVVDVTVPDLIASRFTWREFLEQYAIADISSMPTKFLVFGFSSPRKSAQFQINNYRELPFRIYYVMATEDSDGVMQPESQLLEDLTEIGSLIRTSIYDGYPEYAVMQNILVDPTSANAANELLARFKHALMAVEVSGAITGAMADDLQ